MATREEALALLDEATQSGKVNRANEIRRRLGMSAINESGASFSDRTAVAAARGPGAGMQTLQNRYGQGNVQQFGPDNFLLENDRLFNPPGFDMGDMSMAVRPVAEALGGLSGGVEGMPGGLPGIMAGAGLGGEMAGEMYDTGMQNFAGSADTRGAGARLFDTAMGVGFNSMGGSMPPAQLPGQILGEAGDMALRRALSAADIPPLTPGQMGSHGGQMVEGMVESTATGGPVLDRQRQGVSDAMDSYIDNTFPVEHSRNQMGGIAAHSVTDVVGGKRETVRALYQRLDDLIGSVDEGRISIPASQRLLEDFERRMASDPEYAGLINTDPDLSRYIKTLRDALKETEPTFRSVPTGKPRIGSTGSVVTPYADELVDEGREAAFPLYDTIKQFRTTVGANMTPLHIASTGGVDAEKRRLYGVLSRDLADGAEELGGPGAVQARSRADSYYSALSNRLERIDPVFKSADNPSAVYDAMSTMVLKNPKGLTSVKKTVEPDVWNEFSSTYLRRLMSAKPGAENATGNAMSFSTIATNLNRLKKDSPESYQLLAGDSVDALDNIIVLSNKLRESEKFFNRSRTANAVNLPMTLGSSGSAAGMGFLIGNSPEAAVGAGTAALAANTMIPWLTSKVLTSPTIRNALGKMPTKLMGDITPSRIARALIAAGADEADVAELLTMGDG